MEYAIPSFSSSDLIFKWRIGYQPLDPSRCKNKRIGNKGLLLIAYSNNQIWQEPTPFKIADRCVCYFYYLLADTIKLQIYIPPSILRSGYDTHTIFIL